MRACDTTPRHPLSTPPPHLVGPVRVVVRRVVERSGVGAPADVAAGVGQHVTECMAASGLVGFLELHGVLLRAGEVDGVGEHVLGGCEVDGPHVAHAAAARHGVDVQQALLHGGRVSGHGKVQPGAVGLDGRRQRAPAVEGVRLALHLAGVVQPRPQLVGHVRVCLLHARPELAVQPLHAAGQVARLQGRVRVLAGEVLQDRGVLAVVVAQPEEVVRLRGQRLRRSAR